MRTACQRAIEGASFPLEGDQDAREAALVEGTGETGEVRRRHKRSRHQQKEAGTSTSQPIVAPAPSELHEGAPFASPPVAHHLEPGELPFEAYHSIVAMSGAPMRQGMLVTTRELQGFQADKRSRLLLTLIKRPLMQPILLAAADFVEG